MMPRRGAASTCNVSHFPIPDMDVIDTSGYAAIVDTIRASTDRGGVYVHCWGGIGRTASVVGCLLASDGLPADAALEQITQWRSITRKAHHAAPQTEQQRDAVRQFAGEHTQTSVRRWRRIPPDSAPATRSLRPEA